MRSRLMVTNERKITLITEAMDEPGPGGGVEKSFLIFSGFVVLCCLKFAEPKKQERTRSEQKVKHKNFSFSLAACKSERRTELKMLERRGTSAVCIQIS